MLEITITQHVYEQRYWHVV